MQLSEILTLNQSIAGQLNKVEAEVVNATAVLQAAIADLQAQLANQELPAEVAASFQAVQDAANALDNLNPDA